MTWPEQLRPTSWPQTQRTQEHSSDEVGRTTVPDNGEFGVFVRRVAALWRPGPTAVHWHYKYAQQWLHKQSSGTGHHA